MKLKLFLLTVLTAFGISCYAQNNEKANRILIAYFSWSGNMEHVAKYIAEQTGGTLFRIEPVKP